MPQYLSPGVYVEEVDAGPKPIEGVSTSTAGMVGVTARGVTDGKPVFVTSFAEFVRNFGGYVDVDGPIKAKWEADAAEGGAFWQFPLAVKGFFDNGGQLLYVKRVASKTAVASAGTLGIGVIAEITQDAPKTASTVKVRSLVGIKPNDAITLHVNGAAVALKVASYDSTARTVTFASPLTQAVRNGRDFLELTTVAPITQTPSITATAASPGAWGNSIIVRARPMESAVLNLLPDPTDPANVASFTTVTADAAALADTVKVVSANGFAKDDQVTIGADRYAVKAVDSVANTIQIDGKFPSVVTASTGVARIPVAAKAGTKVVWAAGAGELYANAIVELDNGTTRLDTVVNAITNNKVTFADATTGPLYVGDKLRLVEAEVSVTYTPSESDASAVTETFSYLRLSDDPADPSPDFIITNVNATSDLVRLSPNGFQATSLANFPFAARPVLTPEKDDPAAGWLPIADGDDKLDALVVDDFVGLDLGPGKRTGIQSFEDIDDISIMLAPGLWSQTVQSALITHCELLKYRFAILDPKTNLDIEGVQAFRGPLESKYAALYYPWLVARDPFTQSDELVPPSGHMAGIYARVDGERGVWKAPANEIVRSILRFEQDITKREQDVLNPIGIDALRFFPNRGLLVWGARTVSSDSSWRYINVRRLFIYVERSIDVGTQWVVFEPNDETTWARVRQSVSNFLETVWRNGGLQGAKAEDAYFVRCDYSTMSQDDIDNGRLICVVGIAPVKPAEFVIFRIQQKTTDAAT